MTDALWEFLVVYALLFVLFLAMLYVVELIAWLLRVYQRHKEKKSSMLESSNQYSQFTR